MWGDVITEVLRVAPTLASVLGGPFAGIATTLISHVFGGDAKDPQDMLTRIQADPASSDKLKEIEDKNKLALEQLALQKETIELTDVQGARDMQGISAKTRLWMFCGVLCLICIIFVILYFDSNTEIANLLILLNGVLIRELVSMMRLWWG